MQKNYNQVAKKVSIITPSFNRSQIVHETAASIFNQTYPHWEWVIVDDGSTDNSWEVLQEFAAKDDRVKIFKRDRGPKGACVCRNIAIENSTGDYLIFLDTDDLMASFCLEQRIAAMEKNADCDFVIFPMLLFQNKPDDLRLLWNVENGKDDLFRILTGDPICQGTGTIWKKSSFVEIGMWKEDLMLWQDIELHIRSLLWPMKYVKCMDLAPDVFLRTSLDSLSRTNYHTLPKTKSRAIVFEAAFNKMQEKNVTEKYKEGLQIMGGGIIGSAIKNRHFKIAQDLIQFCKENEIFTKAEIRKFKISKAAYQTRLNKIPVVANLLLNKQHHKEIKSLITSVKYNGPVQL